MADSNTITAASTDSAARAWQKVLANPESQTRFTATDIGWIKRNNSRLNVVSNIGKTDTEQFLKFNVVTAGNLSLTSKSDSAIRIQMINQNNQVVADSDSSSGSLYQAYQSLQSSQLAVKTGVYTLRITRDAKVSPTTEVNYAAQVMMGDTYTDDYVTRIAPEKKTNPSVGLATNPVTGLIPAVLSAQSSSTYTFDPEANAAIFSILQSAAGS